MPAIGTEIISDTELEALMSDDSTVPCTGIECTNEALVRSLCPDCTHVFMWCNEHYLRAALAMSIYGSCECAACHTRLPPEWLLTFQPI